MTPQEERALLRIAEEDLQEQVARAFAAALNLMRDGVAPRDAIEQVMQTFTGEFAEILASGLSAVLAQSVGSAAALEIEVGAVRLSERLYAQAQEVSQTVQGVVDRHAKGFQDARRLTLELYEGYGFRALADEPLQINPRNPVLPKYLREELLTDPGLAGELRRHFTKVQVSKLRTAPLRASYLEFLDALEEGKGQKALEKKLRVAFEEKVRYDATRIAQTELHRAYSIREAKILMDDDDVQFIQIRRSPGAKTHGPCICDLITKADKYGLGDGVYPKKFAPMPPYHPYCRCVASPRLDISPQKKWQDNPYAYARYLDSRGLQEAGRIMGSKAKAEQVLKGNDAFAVYGAKSPPEYRIQTLDQGSRITPEPVRAAP